MVRSNPLGEVSEVQRMSSDTRNHSFSLDPKASDIVNAIRDQQKSRFVSSAILFYDSQKKLTELPSTGEISDDEADCVPQVGVLRRIFHRICSFWL